MISGIHKANEDDFGGSLVCWGINNKGQTDAPSGHFIQVSSGTFHSCAVKDDETVSCWGAQGIAYSPEGSFLQVSAGGYHTCGVLKDGKLKCWGKNYAGQSSPPDGEYVQV